MIEVLMAAPAISSEPTGLHARVNDILQYHRSEGVQNIRIHVAAISSDGDDTTDWANERIYVPSGSGIIRLGQMLRNSFRNRDVDVVHMSNMLTFGSWLLPLIAANKPLIVGPNNTGKLFPVSLLTDEALKLIKKEKGGTFRRWQLYGERLERLKLYTIANHPGGPTTFIAQSDFARQMLQERGIHCTDISILPSGVNTNIFNPSDKTADWPTSTTGLKLLYIGKTTRRKGVELLAKSVATLSTVDDSETPSVVVVGSDHPPEFLLGHPGLKHMTFAGRRRRSELASFYRAADAFVTPSYYEAEPTVMIESLACGTPVVATDNKPFTEIGDTRSCCFFEQGNPESLAEALRRFALNKDEYTRFANQQASDYDIQSTYEHLIGIYRQHAEE
jgi:glycosyltransferase involved in cell wall biosynthesis